MPSTPTGHREALEDPRSEWIGRMDITDNLGTTMKAGDIIKNRTGMNRSAFQVFAEVFSDWFGTVVFLEYGTKYYKLRAVLSSHGGMVCETWMTGSEIREYIEVVHEAR
jgi:hypothetical protein